MPDHDDENFICGESYDHDLTLIAEGDDGTHTYMCEVCGAEIISDDDEDGDELVP